MTNSLQSQAEAAKELLIRRRARSDILQYANAIEVPGRPMTEDPDTEFFEPIETTMAHHHRLILQKLDEISNTPHGRAMFFMPPGSAKSTYASVVFPSNYLGRNANKKIILASYGDDLARKLGRRTRSIIKQPRYTGIFDAGLTVESSAAQEFSLTNGSEYMSCGILGGVTGNRAHGIIIDDPIKGREHEDDLAGRILPDGWKGESGRILCKDGNYWEVVCLPAKCENEGDPLGRKIGEYLWTEWFDQKHWAQFESNPRTWAALYQQRPAPLDGDLFKPDQIQVIDALPAGDIKWCRGWDLASVADGGDYTAGGKLGRLSDGRFVIADMVRLRVGPDQRDAAMVNTASLDGRPVKISIPQDPGQAGKTQVLYLTRALSGYNVKSSPESGDKITRAEPFAAQVNIGNVLMLRGDWNAPLINEMRIFPNGTHDDQVDSLSRAFSEIMIPRKSFFG